MKIISIKTVWLCALLLSLGSCKKWLDVSPKTQIGEKELIGTEQGFKDALMGIYSHLGGSSAYGQNLTMGFQSALQQNYTATSTSHTFYRASRYEYKADATVIGYVSGIWNSMYFAVGNLNNILRQVDEKQPLFTGSNFALVKGEALALRALVHFDLLRDFGVAPVVDGNRKSIPYVTGFGVTASPLLTVNQVIDSCLRDLSVAQQLLSVDKSVRSDYATDPFLSYTRNRMNYWAVKGLMARIYLYKGDKENALAAAQEVINNQAGRFPFVTASAAAASQNRDRLYYSEHLFSVYAYKISDYVTAYYKTAASNGTPTLFTSSANLTALYETASGGSSDLRFNYQFSLYPGGYSATKYWQDDIFVEYLRGLVPVVRLSEMYYIAAECAATPAEGVAYLNTIRTNRGLTSLPTTINATTLEAEILKEYKKEMYGEGQLFFYFKRKNAARVDGSTVNMTDATWTLPLPDDEVEFGK
jgi:starch-binding outer membrane protein, SusD/RagB family